MCRFPALALLMASVVALAEDAPQSAAAKKAKVDFEAATKKLDDEYLKKVNALREACLKELEEARTNALAKKDLAEATRVLAELRDLTEEPATTAPFQVLAAWNGSYDSWADVTAPARKLVRNGELRLPAAGNVNKGPDPAFGLNKALVVVYRAKGVVRVAVVANDKPLALPSPR